MERAVIVYTTWPSIVEAEKAGCILPVEAADSAHQAWMVNEIAQETVHETMAGADDSRAT